MTEQLLITGFILLAALLYASVGHGGASGYLAVMALAGIAPAEMKPAALALNILVAGLATWRFGRVGNFSWPLFWPLALTAVPCAFLGGVLVLPAHLYKPLVGVVLLYAAWRLFLTAAQPPAPTTTPPRGALLAIGAALGFLSGLTGVGGGIFLSPLLLFLRWAETRVVSGVAAAFILVNSIAGLLGVFTHDRALPAELPYWAVAAVIGGWIGAEYGSRKFAGATLRRLLALVLVIAGAKMIATS